ncbi:unnamed protein product [Rhodiola kirilowii]
MVVTTKPHLSISIFPFSFYETPNKKLPSAIFKPNQSPKHNAPVTAIPQNYQPNLVQTKQIHAHLIKTAFDSSHNILSLLSSKTHFSTSAKYNFIITSYTKNNQPTEAMTIYEQMRKWGIEVDSFLIPSLVKACTEKSWIRIGEELHGYALRNGLAIDGFVNNALMQMYGESGRVDSARLLFDEMCVRDVVSWSTMIRNYSKNGHYSYVLEFIREMFAQGVKPSEAAMVSMFNLCGDLVNLRMGKTLHCYVIKNLNVDQLGVQLGTSLVDMYAKCGCIDSARSLFDALEDRSVVSWTVMIAGYIRCDNLDEAARMCSRMLKDNVTPNEISMLSFVIECGFAGAVEFGKQVHAYILRNGFHFSVALATALVDMYAKCFELKAAKTLFDNVDHRDVMTWTAMVTAYAKSLYINEAFDLFVDMRNSGIEPNEVTMVSLLAMCGEAGVLDMGKWIHAYIDKQGVEVDTILCTALVDMYSKCGDINAAKRVFSEVTARDIGLWNAIICGLAMHGHGEEALQFYSEMLQYGIRPNDITFIGILHACSHAGLVSEGRQIFKEMTDFQLVPKIEHYGCIVDILGRVGLLDQAYQMIQTMPIKPNFIVWGTLLAACRLHRNSKLGEIAAGKLRELNPQNCGYDVLISNIYAAANRWNEVSGVRKAIKDSGIKKDPGLSIIEVNGSVYEFMTGDRSHPLIAKIDEMLAEMNKNLKEVGYMADTSVVLRNISEEDKETSLTYHSEKLAMAFGLVSTSPGMPIRVMKNLRICEDCHAATKLLSAIYEREFIVRDRNRFHLFKEGSCSCGDFW